MFVEIVRLFIVILATAAGFAVVVVGWAAAMVGCEVGVRITSKVETSVGRMLFASMAAEG